ncbi:heat-shock protein [Grimontia hollisae]|uniref:heat-shock protein n=1 Tax=Grimontia hollisae TaxID=673 RepID=UPI001E3FEBEF|nr:heat-shock protein [Grimontia hollisae]
MEPLLFLAYGNPKLMARTRLFNLSDHAVQQWNAFEKNGQIFDLSHLDARQIVFNHPKRDEHYVLYFTFSNHCFTRSIKVDEMPSEVDVYPYPKDRRVFSEARYNLSFHLPHIIETLPEQFCYHGGYSRYCSCKITQEDGSEIYYQVVYRVWKEKAKMRLHVESAYPLDNPLGKVKKVDFWVICHNLLRGKPMPKPAR